MNAARSPLEDFVDGVPLDLAQRTLQSSLPQLLGGGDEAAYFNMRASEVLPTAVLAVRQPVMPFGSNPRLEVGHVEATTTHGTLSLDDFLATPETYSQGYLVVHRGEIVYEQYPRMHAEDHHLWMSNAKPITSLVIELLIDDGKLSDSDTMGSHIPEFRGTAWEHIRVVDVLDMTPGLDTQENDETRADPDSIATRTFLAEFGTPYNGRVERLIEVMAAATKVQEPGVAFDYGSINTEALVLLAEAIENKRWPQIFDERVWSKIGAEAPLQLHTTPDGIAAADGLVSSRLRDMARFGMLYTPSWRQVSVDQVVTPGIIDRIRSGVRSPEFFRNGFDGPVFVDRLGDDTMISNSRMWDAVWPDGDIWKSGLMAQGLYVSPDRDLVIAYFSVNAPDATIHRYLRPLATSGLFDSSS